MQSMYSITTLQYISSFSSPSQVKLENSGLNKKTKKKEEMDSKLISTSSFYWTCTSLEMGDNVVSVCFRYIFTLFSNFFIFVAGEK